MSEVIKVWVAKFGDRAHYQLQWRDPITSRLRTKSTRIRRSGLARDRKVAERMAGELEVKLNAGEAVIPSRFLWQDFRARYEAEVVPGLAPRTGEKISSVFDRFEADINPRRLWDVDEKRLSAFVSNLRKGEGGRGKLAESTIAGHLAHLKAALNWAKLQKLVAHLPGFPRIKRAKMSKGAKVMRGRPITTEEFERMLGKVEDVVGQAAAEFLHAAEGLLLFIGRAAQRAKPPAHQAADGGHAQFRRVLVSTAIKQRCQYFEVAFPVHRSSEFEAQADEYLLTIGPRFAGGECLPVGITLAELVALIGGHQGFESTPQVGVTRKPSHLRQCGGEVILSVQVLEPGDKLIHRRSGCRWSGWGRN